MQIKMDKLIAEFPKNIDDALETARSLEFKSLHNKNFTSVVICGMGGSGIGGKLVAQLVAAEANIPILANQNYNLPEFINETTLVIGSSYSGYTEETLTAVKAAKDKGATIAAVCSGGELYDFCKANNYDVVKMPAGNPPRSALAFSSIHLLNMLFQAGVISDLKLKELENCREHLNNHILEIKEEAKKLAEFIPNKELIMYSTPEFEPVVIRARQQYNENAKILCSHHVVPEMNHNELVGWGGGDDRYGVLFIDSPSTLERNKFRMNLCKEIIAKKTPHVFVLEAKGANLIEEVMYIIHIIDWSSIMLADIFNVDPIEIDVINYLKGELSKI